MSRPPQPPRYPKQRYAKGDIVSVRVTGTVEVAVSEYQQETRYAVVLDVPGYGRPAGERVVVECTGSQLRMLQPGGGKP